MKHILCTIVHGICFYVQSGVDQKFAKDSNILPWRLNFAKSDHSGYNKSICRDYAKNKRETVWSGFVLMPFEDPIWPIFYSFSLESFLCHFNFLPNLSPSFFVLTRWGMKQKRMTTMMLMAQLEERSLVTRVMVIHGSNPAHPTLWQPLIRSVHN